MWTQLVPEIRLSRAIVAYLHEPITGERGRRH
jgi:hypothetical protein